jgi:hypothetical protein
MRFLRAFSCAAGTLACIAASAFAANTKTHIYEAFKADGSPAIKVTKTVDGSCFSGSIAIDRKDAWRCTSASTLADPCFSSAKAHGYVLCPAAPWKRSGIKIHLTKKLILGNKRSPSTKGDPWGIQTSGGLRCAIATGATTTLDHKRANYFCKNSTDWLWGSPIRTSEPWKIFIAPIKATKLSKKTAITVAWF